MKLICIDASPTCYPDLNYLPELELMGVYTLDHIEQIFIHGIATEVYALKEFGEGYYYNPDRFIPLTENIEA